MIPEGTRRRSGSANGRIDIVALRFKLSEMQKQHLPTVQNHLIYTCSPMSCRIDTKQKEARKSILNC